MTPYDDIYEVDFTPPPCRPALVEIEEAKPGLPGPAGHMIRSATPPADPDDGDEWLNSANLVLYAWAADVGAWVQILSSENTVGTRNITGGKPNSVYTHANIISGGTP